MESYGVVTRCHDKALHICLPSVDKFSFCKTDNCPKLCFWPAMAIISGLAAMCISAVCQLYLLQSWVKQQ
jgi:hypothetical protein